MDSHQIQQVISDYYKVHGTVSAPIKAENALPLSLSAAEVTISLYTFLNYLKQHPATADPNPTTAQEAARLLNGLRHLVIVKGLPSSDEYEKWLPLQNDPSFLQYHQSLTTSSDPHSLDPVTLYIPPLFSVLEIEAQKNARVGYYNPLQFTPPSSSSSTSSSLSSTIQPNPLPLLPNPPLPPQCEQDSVSSPTSSSTSLSTAESITLRPLGQFTTSHQTTSPSSPPQPTHHNNEIAVSPVLSTDYLHNNTNSVNSQSLPFSSSSHHPLSTSSSSQTPQYYSSITTNPFPSLRGLIWKTFIVGPLIISSINIGLTAVSHLPDQIPPPYTLASADLFGPNGSFREGRQRDSSLIRSSIRQPSVSVAPTTHHSFVSRDFIEEGIIEEGDDGLSFTSSVDTQSTNSSIISIGTHSTSTTRLNESLNTTSSTGSGATISALSNNSLSPQMMGGQNLPEKHQVDRNGLKFDKNDKNASNFDKSDKNLRQNVLLASPSPTTASLSLGTNNRSSNNAIGTNIELSLDKNGKKGPNSSPNVPNKSHLEPMPQPSFFTSAHDYFTILSHGKSKRYTMIRDDSFRTFRTDLRFDRLVPEQALIRVCNAFDLQFDPYLWKYCQGMNIYAGMFLYTMPELDAYNAFVLYCTQYIPYYWRSNHIGVEAGCAVLDLVLNAIDPELYHVLTNLNPKLFAILYAFSFVKTMSASACPLSEVVKLWDVQLAMGPFFNICCVAAQIIDLKPQIMASSFPKSILDYRAWPALDAGKVAMEGMDILIKIFHRKDLIQKLQFHHSHPATISKLAGRQPDVYVHERL